LPQWCNGLLTAFKLINERKLNKLQQALLARTDSHIDQTKLNYFYL
jgi:hypothetical protein